MSERHPFDSDERAVLRAYTRASALLREALNRDVEAQAGMSLNEYEVLEHLAEAPGGAVRMSALAEALVSSRSRLTHTVHRMESRGLVQRRACEADGRGVYCVITPLGKQTYDAAEPGHVASVRAYLFERATPRELEVLGRLMARIADDFSGHVAGEDTAFAERVG